MFRRGSSEQEKKWKDPYFQRFWVWWYRWSDNIYIKWIFPILLSTSSLVPTGDRLGSQFPHTWLFPQIHDFLQNFTFLIYFSYFSPLAATVIVAMNFTAREKSRGGNGLSEDALALLLVSLESIVGKKANRFSNHAKECKLNGWTKDIVFEKITQPSKQYEAIVEGVYTFFRSQVEYKGVDFEVALARMGTKHIKEIVAFAPSEKPPFPVGSNLRSSNCGFSYAYKKKEILIVADIEKEITKGASSRYIKVDGQEAYGSMICCPIRHKGGSKIPFVLSIVASKKNTFHEYSSEKTRFNAALGAFEARLSLEYSLELLIQNSNGRGISHVEPTA